MGKDISSTCISLKEGMEQTTIQYFGSKVSPGGDMGLLPYDMFLRFSLNLFVRIDPKEAIRVMVIQFGKQVRV